MLTSRWVRPLPFVIAFVLAAQAGLAPGCPAEAGIFAWMGGDGGAALRAAETRDTLGWIRPGLYGPGWTGFTQRTTGSPEEVESGCWRYAGALIPDGQEGIVDYTVTARGVAGGVGLAYAFTTRGSVSLNALSVRVELPVGFAAGARVDESLHEPVGAVRRLAVGVEPNHVYRRVYGFGGVLNLSVHGREVRAVADVLGLRGGRQGDPRQDARAENERHADREQGFVFTFHVPHRSLIVK